jgi:nucleotide-binding universal stress UspA family protein
MKEGAMSEHLFGRILVADDGSPEGEHAATVAVELAAKCKAEVILLGVVEPANVQADGEGLPMDDGSMARRRLEERFERFLVLGRTLGVRMVVEIVEGVPATEISHRAESDQADLIVVGKHTAGHVRRWFERHTSDAVLRESRCSVLVVR